MAVPEIRVQPRNARAVAPDGKYVLYWMIASRRTRWSFALDRAVEWTKELDRPLLVLEALRCDYPWASDRLHAFVLDGMRENAERCPGYYPYVEPRKGAGKGLLEALAKDACVVVTDEFPCFFLPRMVEAAAERCPVLLETVDGNGLLPLRATDRDYPTAYAFRRFLQRELPEHLACPPRKNALRGVDGAEAPAAVAKRWPPGIPDDLAALPIDHGIEAVERPAPRTLLDRFVKDRLDGYAEKRNDPAAETTSGLSPYLHFGHVSAHEVFDRVAAHEEWEPENVGPKADGKRAGWWGMGKGAEAFLDQLVTWRELGYHFCFHRDDYAEYDALPDWARETLADHADDPRDEIYSLDALAGAETEDEIWNAAQRQLAREGRIHNYLRMLWGKNVLGWTRSPQKALEVLVELNNRYALDGRNPNSYSGIFWCLGRFDRAWGPERPVFGKVRYMSSANTRRKLSLGSYLERYAG